MDYILRVFKALANERRLKIKNTLTTNWFFNWLNSVKSEEPKNKRQTEKRIWKLMEKQKFW